MLYEFVTVQRDAIIARASQKAVARLFLTQLAATLQPESAPACSNDARGGPAAGSAADRLAPGFSIGQVIDGYVNTCRAITAIAFEQNAPLTVEEFHTLDRCLDEAIAEAVTVAHVSRAGRP